MQHEFNQSLHQGSTQGNSIHTFQSFSLISLSFLLLLLRLPLFLLYFILFPSTPFSLLCFRYDFLATLFYFFELSIHQAKIFPWLNLLIRSVLRIAGIGLCCRRKTPLLPLYFFCLKLLRVPVGSATYRRTPSSVV